jgi:hypothetical protein
MMTSAAVFSLAEQGLRRGGVCPLTTNPWTSILYGMLIGASAAGSVR